MGYGEVEPPPLEGVGDVGIVAMLRLVSVDALVGEVKE
jgi:hypothetical protein